MDIRQSPIYGHFMEKIGWRMEQVGKWQAFIKQFLFLGSFIKIQRIKKPIPFAEIEELAKKYRAFKVAIEPDNPLEESLEKEFYEHGYRINNSPFLPTKTLKVDLDLPVEQIFSLFREAKRRAVRRAIKNGAVIKESDDIENFIQMKNNQLGILKFFLGHFQKKEIIALWQTFFPKNAILLLAFKSAKTDTSSSTQAYASSGDKPIAGVLLLFYDEVAYYWLAAATNEGKKLFAPSLLVWEAIKLAKKRGGRIFDFEGIYDPRFPQKSWSGFSKFKKGFGGKEITWSPPLVKTSLLWYK